VLQRLGAFLDWFSPPDDGADLLRARAAVGISFLMFLVFGLLTATHVLTGHRTEALINGGLGAIVGFGPFALRWSGRRLATTNIVLAAVAVGITIVALADRGAGINAATIAIAELPLFATLLAGIRVGSIWAIIASGISIGIGIHGAYDRSRPQPPMLINDHVVLVVITGTLFLVAVLYERGRVRSLSQIHALEESRHRAEIEQLRLSSDARVAQASQLAVLGRVAAAVAHEINNPLASTLANLDMLAEEGDLHAPDARAMLADAAEGARRVHRIVSSLRQFTEPPAASSVANLKAAVAAALEVAASQLRGRVHPRFEIDDTWFVRSDAARLTQVFLNLLVNAAQSIPEGHESEHRLVIGAKRDGEAIVVEIEDSGVGLPPDVIQEINHHAFSSKPTGEGLGLGLAMSHAIVAAIGGALTFESRPGCTVARIRLVAAAAPSAGSQPGPLSPSSVLVVDDEVDLLKVIKRLLSRHQVTTAGSGAEALQLLEAGARFDVIVCDVMMPDLCGMDLYDAVRKRAPSEVAKFVFMTGGTYTARAEAFRQSIDNVFLEKPLDVRALRAAVDSTTARSRA